MTSTPDQTAERILVGRMGRFDITFTWFREQMIEEHPDYLTDDVLLDLYHRHVVVPTKGDQDAFGVDPPPRPKCPRCGSGMDPWGCVKCNNTKQVLDEPEAEVKVLSPRDQYAADLAAKEDPTRPMEEGDDYLRRQRQLMDNIINREKVNKNWQGWSAPTTERPASKPLGDRTLAEVANAVTKKARAIVRIALGSHRDT